MASNERPRTQNTYPPSRLERPDGTRRGTSPRPEPRYPVGYLPAMQQVQVERHGGLNPHSSSSNPIRMERHGGLNPHSSSSNARRPQADGGERPGTTGSGRLERADIQIQHSASSPPHENNARTRTETYEDMVARHRLNLQRPSSSDNQRDQHEAQPHENDDIITLNNVTLNGLGQDTYTGRTPQAGRRHYFNHGITYQKSLVLAGKDTRASQPTWYKDIMQREGNIFHQENSFIETDGRVMPLVVQATDLVYLGAVNSTWDRTFVRNTSPLIVRLASWTIDRLSDTRGWTKRDWTWLVCQWGFSCIGLIPLLPLYLFSSPAGARNAARYDPFRYRDWHYCKTPRNNHEANPSLKRTIVTASHMPHHGDRAQSVDDGDFEQVLQNELGDSSNPEDYRTLRPRILCFLRNPFSPKMCGYDPKFVDDWMIENNAQSHPEYIFVAWTKLHFKTDSDKMELLKIGERAAREAQLHAFWCSVACISEERGEDGLLEDVWRMSDIVRGSNRTAIVLATGDLDDTLIGWGRRMWTLPEALLSPKGESVSIYRRGETLVQKLEKRNLAVRVWTDSQRSRQLMDHFEGSLILSQLELTVIALECLNNRDTNDFTIGGEMAYVLMGLLRRRPKVDLSDSAFQAFARLSLANDNNMLLERLICVMPKHHHQAWHDTSDWFDAKLFDIYPTCQIAGIGFDDSVVLDGAQGAVIRWDRFERVPYTNKDSFRRTASRYTLMLSPIVLFTGITLAVTGQKVAGILLLLVALAILGAAPYLIRLLFTGKLWDTQALFFGFEGYMDIATIETHIFGANMNRLTWSPYGSSLSKHKPGTHGECVGLDPTTDKKTAKLVKKACTAKNRPGELKVFTLVDTFTMTVVMFLAERPPVVALLCGREGGMQRAVLCSYQSSTQTLCREAVLRMESRTAERFWLVGRLRFAFRRSMVAQNGPAHGNVEDREGASGTTPTTFATSSRAPRADQGVNSV